MADAGDPLAILVDTVRASPKYRSVSVELVRSIGARELAKRRPLKEAIKATKNRLHQVGGAYQERRIDYAACLDALRQAAAAADPIEWRSACRQVMERHTSTRERLPILDEFHATALAGIGPIRSVVDLACGLHPLSIPWMPLADDVEYYAYDVYEDMVDFLNAFMTLHGCRGRAEVVDVTELQTAPPVDLALILKSLPCLEQLHGDISLRLLESIPAAHLLISFPVHTLGGRQKGMAGQYETRLRERLAEKSWRVTRYAFATELALLVSK
jgi:16S rRNA (guanine(1405)-N(7))-methyltransferase